MSRVLLHRGPDEEGIYAEDGVFLAMRRLAILDLTPGQLPVSNENGRIVVVFNGEIFNFRELRADLQARGYRFRTKMDTEVIVHLFEEHGPAFLDHLRGMFAIALWDGRERTLWLARDRLGKKPLYYHLDGQALTFGSEIKAILADPSVSRSMDPEGLVGILTLGYPTAPRTFYRNILELPPGHRLRFRHGEAEVRSYWTPPIPQEHVPSEDLEDGLQQAIKEAVELRLVSDVPLGAFLSGGIDSSVIVATMAQLGQGTVKTFNVSFGDPAYDEAQYARIVAERFGTEHHELRVEADLFGVLPLLVWHHDGPFADSSAIPTYFVSKLAREHVTVALSGDGGDEVFGGYDMYKAHRMARLWAYLPTWFRTRFLPPLLARIPQRRSRSVFRLLSEFSQAAGYDIGARHTRWVSVTKPDLRARLLQGGPLEPYADSLANEYLESFFSQVPDADPVAAAMYVDLRSFLPGDMLVKVDRMSMAVSLEVRCPLLDHKLVEYLSRLPGSCKVRGFRSKALLKQVARRSLPASIIGRKKRGFRVPVASWFRDEHRDSVRDLLLNPQALAAELFDRTVLREMLDDHADGTRDYSRELFTLVTLEHAQDQFLRPGPLQTPCVGAEASA